MLCKYGFILFSPNINRQEVKTVNEFCIPLPDQLLDGFVVCAKGGIALSSFPWV